MTGPEHWREADLILTGDRCSYGCPHTGCEHETAALAAAQAHATLAATAFAAAAESVRLGTLPPSAMEAWREAADPREPEEVSADA